MHKKSKVIIIGAGLAGLAASQRFNEANVEAIILEARPRAGGRVFVDKSWDRPIGLGASWIHGINQNPIYDLAVRTGAAAFEINFDRLKIFDRNGDRIPEEIIKKFNVKFDNYLEQAKQFANQLQKDVSLAEALHAVMPTENFSLTEEDLFNRRKLFFEGYVGASYHKLSARRWDQEDQLQGNHLYIQTYDPIISFLREKSNIYYNTIVEEINLDANSISINTSQGIYFADFVIVTLPLGVLKTSRVIFNPSLSANKIKAIQRLGMGSFTINAFMFSRVFWHEDHVFLRYTEDLSSISTFINLYPILKKPILLGYAGGDRAIQIDNLSDEEVIKNTMKSFRKIYGDSAEDPIHLLRYPWSKDPFSFGSYCYMGVGADEQDLKVLAEPIDNRLFFAGEATHEKYLATTHGAYFSGIREAERILNLLCPIP